MCSQLIQNVNISFEIYTNLCKCVRGTLEEPRRSSGEGSGAVRGRFGGGSAAVRGRFGGGSGAVRGRFGEGSGNVWGSHGGASGAPLTHLHIFVHIFNEILTFWISCEHIYI